MDDVFVVAKGPSIHSTIIGVASDLDGAKKLCHEDYENNSKASKSQDTFACFEMSKLYTGPTRACYDYVPSDSGQWQEVKVERFFNYSEVENEDRNNG